MRWSEITDKFLNLQSEKQKKILNAAYKEFADYGYKNASTNRIVKAAEIGKGMLFYYFESKRGLYDDLFTYGLNFIHEQYLNKINMKEQDFIERYKQASILKLQVFHEVPDIFRYFGNYYTAFADINPLTDEQKEGMNKMKQEGYKKIYSNLNTSLFRKDLKSEEVMELIRMTFDGYEKKLIQQLGGAKLTEELMEALSEEFYLFLNQLKLVYYEK